MSLQRLLSVKRASILMMRKRGYRQLVDIGEKEDDILVVCKEDYLATAASYFQEGNTYLRQYLIAEGLTTIRSMMSAIYIREKRGQYEKCVVLFADTDGKKVLTREIRLIAQLLVDPSIQATQGIIISQEEIGTTAISNIKILDTKTPVHVIQHFQDAELLYDPADHIYSPIKVEELTPEELVALKERVESLRSLPNYLTSDPIVKRMGYLPGTVLRITNQTTVRGTLLDSEINYRLVVQTGTEKKQKKKS